MSENISHDVIDATFVKACAALMKHKAHVQIPTLIYWLGCSGGCSRNALRQVSDRLLLAFCDKCSIVEIMFFNSYV